MEKTKTLTDFLSAVTRDPRIGPIHIALFTVLYNKWIRDGFPRAILIASYQIMPLAKIASRVTFCKTIKELHEYGYLKYEPFFNRRGSKVYL